MKKNYKKNLFTYLIFAAGALWACSQATAQVTTQTLSYSGSVQTFTVPQCVTTITVDLRGAQGANAADRLTSNSTGGLGGRAIGILTVTGGQVLNIYVGGAGSTTGVGGFNGGGAGGLGSAGGSCFGGYGGGGGGASDIRIGGTALSNRVIVAGGGGGSGRDYCNGSCQPCGCGGNGGGGGGLSGIVGGAAMNCNFGSGGGGTNGGPPGTATGPGAGGIGDANTGNNGTAGALGVGGSGSGGTQDVAGGGGGGGYYGGGGGGGAANGSGVGGGGGGGGSSYITGLTGASTTSNTQAGDGLILLTYEIIGASVAATPSMICTGQSSTLTASGMVSYTWSPGSSNSTSIVVSPTGTSIYTIAATSSLGCVVSKTVIVNVNSSVPVVTVSQNTTQVCPTQTVLFTASGALTYSWTGGVTNGVAFAPPATGNYTVTGTNGCGSTNAVASITVAPLPIVVVSSNSVLCANYSSTLTAAGAANYTWSTGQTTSSVIVTPSVTSIYTVVGTTSVCSGTTTTAISVNPNPTITTVASSTNICAGEVVTVTVSGATTYTLPGGGSGNTFTVSPTTNTNYPVPGSYTTGCFSIGSQVVTVKPTHTVSIAASKTLVCVGGTVALYANGANSYLWNNASTSSSLLVTPTVNTSYSVVGTSSATGCTANKLVSITVFSVPLAVSAATDVCLGNSVTISAGGAQTYTWGPQENQSSYIVSPSVTTVYTVAATSSTLGMKCPTSGTILVTVNPLPTVTAVANRTTMCRNESNTLTASGASVYAWSNNNTNAVFTIKPTNTNPINLTVTGTNSLGCSNSATLAIKVSACTGIDEVTVGQTAKVFPNPSGGIFTISFDSTPKNTIIWVYNTLGHLVKIQEVNSEKVTIDLEKEANGIYLLDIIQDGKSKQITKIIKE